jgi:DNA-binding MarR family transcriptional regulator
VAPAPTQRLWSAIVAVYQPVLRDVVTALERDAGIDSGAYSVLAYLDQAGGRLRLRELQELMRVRYSQPGLSRLVQRLETDGAIERHVDPGDRRATTVALTRRGRQRYRRAHDIYDAALDAALADATTGSTATSLAESLEGIAARRGRLAG